MRTSEAKKLAIKASIRATKLRRKSQVCRVFELKIDESHLNRREKEQLKMYFNEAKWLYNHILDQADVFKFDTKQRDIMKMNEDKVLEPYQLQFLPAANRRDIRNALCNNIKGLAAAKRKGRKVGRLKHKKQYNSLWFSQAGVTHAIKGKNRFRLVGIKRPLLVSGLKQIQKNCEIADCHLLRKPKGYYIKLTTFRFPETRIDKEKKKAAVGLDFGIKTAITTSDGDKYDAFIGEPERLKRLQRRQAKSVKGSNNRRKWNRLIAIEYQKLNSRKQEAANQLVHKLKSQYHTIVIQDENLKGWQKGRYGKKVQHSILGLVKQKLRNLKQTIIIGRYQPTTKACYVCGVLNETIALDDRIFVCESCGHIEDRDIKAAKTILKLGLAGVDIIQAGGIRKDRHKDKDTSKNETQIPTGRREFKPVEKETSTLAQPKASLFH
jgi:putative transposase